MNVKHKFKKQVFRSCWTSYADARHMMTLKVWMVFTVVMCPW